HGTPSLTLSPPGGPGARPRSIDRIYFCSPLRGEAGRAPPATLRRQVDRGHMRSAIIGAVRKPKAPWRGAWSFVLGTLLASTMGCATFTHSVARMSEVSPEEKVL